MDHPDAEPTNYAAMQSGFASLLKQNSDGSQKVNNDSVTITCMYKTPLKTSVISPKTLCHNCMPHQFKP